MKQPHDMVLTAVRAAVWMQAEGAVVIERYVRGQLQPDGGFRGRSPASDLYYTVFGLSCLAALNGALPVASVRRYLEALGEGPGLDFVHLASGARCWAALSEFPSADRGRALLRRMEAYRAADGGYHHLDAHAPHGTVYGGFLAFLAYEEVGCDMPERGTLLAGIRSLRTGDGGYANAADMAVSTTTATAAALLMQQWIEGNGEAAAIQALQACECPSGGYLAFNGAPGPDLLSTATALYALKRAGRPPRSVEPHAEFVESLWADNGGFCGHPADPTTDCEYTFYALLALGSCVGRQGAP